MGLLLGLTRGVDALVLGDAVPGTEPSGVMAGGIMVWPNGITGCMRLIAEGVPAGAAGGAYGADWKREF